MAQPKLTEIKLKSDKFYPLLDMIYPIGAIYWSKNNTSPASLFGGTWVQIIEDRFPLFGNNDTTGGSRTVSISVANLPSHTHNTGRGNTGGGVQTGALLDKELGAETYLSEMALAILLPLRPLVLEQLLQFPGNLGDIITLGEEPLKEGGLI